MYRFVYIILNYVTYEMTLRQVDELYDSNLRDRLILIVDNHSPNQSFEALTEALKGRSGIEVVSTPKNEGFAKGNNYGLRYADKYEPEYVCVINNDVHFDRMLIDRLSEKYERLANACVISPLQYFPNGQLLKMRPLEYPTFKKDCERYLQLPRLSKRHEYKEDVPGCAYQTVFTVPGAFFFARYENIKAINFLYEGTFLYGEEDFLGARVMKAGMKNYLILDERYIHDHGKTIGTQKSEKQKKRLMFDGVLLFSKEERRDNHLKSVILKLCYHLFMMRTQFVNYFRKRIE